MKDYEIFISHSTRDSELVTKLVEAIEAAGYRCWVSPRDIRAGIPYAHAIMEGLDACKVFVVVLTDNSVKSEHVLNEIDNAQNTGKHIIPLRRRDDGLELPREFKYYLSRTQHVFTDGNNFTGIIAKMGLAPKQPQAPVEKPQANEVTVDEIAKKGLAYLKKKNYTAALPLLLEAAEKGNLEAMAAVGRIYDEGLGVKSDDVKAREWYTKAAEAGYTAVYFRLSELPLPPAANPPKNLTELIAIKKAENEVQKVWLQKAADVGDSRAQYKIARNYENACNLEKALTWYLKAIEAGSLAAIERIGIAYYYGSLGLQKDYVKASQLLMDVASKSKLYDMSKIDAIFLLGCIYRDGGFGVRADMKKAIDYFHSEATEHRKFCIELIKALITENSLSQAASWLAFARKQWGDEKEVRDILNSNLKLRILAMLK